MLVDFYHLTASPLERVLPRICERVVAEGGRMLVICEPALIDGLDALLWTYARDSFLPHGRSDGPDPARQPILLSSEAAAPNGARNVAIADGAWREDVLEFERVFYFFDGARLETARDAWRALKANPEAQCRYWKQVEGKWVEGP